MELFFKYIAKFKNLVIEIMVFFFLLNVYLWTTSFKFIKKDLFLKYNIFITQKSIVIYSIEYNTCVLNNVLFTKYADKLKCFSCVYLCIV